MKERELSEAKYVRLYKDQIDAIEDYRASKRPIPDFSDVLREIIDIGLEALKKKQGRS